MTPGRVPEGCTPQLGGFVTGRFGWFRRPTMYRQELLASALLMSDVIHTPLTDAEIVLRSTA